MLIAGDQLASSAQAVNQHLISSEKFLGPVMISQNI